MRRPCVAVALAVAATARIAHANGRTPEPIQIHFAPNNATDIYLQVTFGMLESHDAGATWRWVCEEAIGYSGMYDPDYAVTSTGALFATTFDGLKVRRDGCVFDLTSLGAQMITSVTTDAAGATVYAGGVGTTSPIYISTNDGKDFNPSTTGLSGLEAWWTSIEVAPSNPQIVFATGYYFPSAMPKVRTMYKSSNAGGSWTPLAVTGFTTTTDSDILIASISPDDPTFLLAEVSHPKGTGVGNAIYRSINGGATWTQVLEFDDYVDGVVIRKLAGPGPANTKAEVVIGTRFSGTWDSTDGGQTFTEVAFPASAMKTPVAIELSCMQEKNGTLWACGNNLAPDLMALGKSTSPAQWNKVLQFKDLAGTVTCAAGTVEEDTCDQQRWCTLRTQLGVVANPTGCSSPGADGTPSDAPTTVKKPPPGCCSVGDGPAGAALLVAGTAAISLRRRRRRRS